MVPLWRSNSAKLSKIGDDYCGLKVYRFEGSKVLSVIIGYVDFIGDTQPLRTISNLFLAYRTISVVVRNRQFKVGRKTKNQKPKTNN